MSWARPPFPRLSRRRLALLAAALAAASPAAAQADVRPGAVQDPQEGPCYENIDGGRRCEPFDLQGVAVSYDAAGALRLDFVFYEPLPPADSYETRSLNVGLAEWDSSSGCFATAKGDLSLTLTLPPDAAGPYSADRMGLAGYEGSIPFTATLSLDRRQVTVEASHPALANRGWNCATRTELDYGDGDAAPAFRIGPVPACDDGEDNDGDGQIDAKDWGCSRADDSTEQLVYADIPRLTVSDTQRYIRVALRRRFGSAFRNGYVLDRYANEHGPAVNRCRRFSPHKVNCAVLWFLGDVAYHGRTTIWYRQEGERIAWNYAYRIKRVDEYCLFVTHGRRCTKTYVVR